MRVSDYILLASRNLKSRRKKVYVGVILMSLAIIIFVISLSYINKFLDNIEKAVNKNISYRTLAILPNNDDGINEITEDLSNIQNIVKVVPQNEFLTGADIKSIGKEEIQDGSISLEGASEEIQPNIINGRGFLEGEKDVCVIPEKFYPFTSDENFDPKKIIDGNSLIGEIITINYYAYDYREFTPEVSKTFEKKITVIGVYDQDENLGEYSECYVPFENMTEIISEKKENTIYVENAVVVGGEGFFAIVDDAKNLENVAKKLNGENYRVIVRSVANTELIEIIKTVCVAVVSILLFVAFFNITISNIKSSIERKYEIGMQKAIGFKNRQIQGIMFTENIIISIISYIVAIIFSLITDIILKKCVININPQLYQMDLNINIKLCIIALAISVILPIISSIICNTFSLKKAPSLLNKER